MESGNPGERKAQTYGCERQSLLLRDQGKAPLKLNIFIL